MLRVVHFEIPADDPARAVEFYRSMFGWQIENANMPGVDYYLATTGETSEIGINGAVMPRTDLVRTVSNVVEVPDIDECLAAVGKYGGSVLTDKQYIPGIGTFAYCQDTEDNVFGVMQPELPAEAPQEG